MKKYTIFLASWLMVSGALLLGACHDKEKAYAKNDVVFKNLDISVHPGDDFFKYANGSWLKKNPIPAAYAAWGIGNVVEEELRDRLKKINLQALSAHAKKGTNTQKIGDFYFSGMDTLDIEKRGLAPLSPELARIDQVKNVGDLVDEFAHLQTIGVETPIAAGVGQDPKNSSKNMLQLYQGGLGMPNRDFYYNADRHSTTVRNDYQQKHLPIVYKLSGLTDAAANGASKQTYKLERFLADNSRKLEDLRDPYHNYNKMPLAGLTKLCPAINWERTFEAMDYHKADTVIVGQPEYYKALNNALKLFTIDDWKNYLRKNLLTAFGFSLNKSID